MEFGLPDASWYVSDNQNVLSLEDMARDGAESRLNIRPEWEWEIFAEIKRKIVMIIRVWTVWIKCLLPFVGCTCFPPSPSSTEPRARWSELLNPQDTNNNAAAFGYKVSVTLTEKSERKHYFHICCNNIFYHNELCLYGCSPSSWQQFTLLHLAPLLRHKCSCL